ncbi:hypothetical protein KCV06_g6032, partial [Aureobasidium melanogenum]
MSDFLFARHLNSSSLTTPLSLRACFTPTHNSILPFFFNSNLWTSSSTAPPVLQAIPLASSSATIPPKGSKRIEVVTLTDEPNKKPRLDLEEQIKRAATLAAQLQNGVKDDDESKSAAATKIATEELMRIFKSMQEKTNDASLSFEGLIATQIEVQVKLKMATLQKKSGYHMNGMRMHLGDEITEYLAPDEPASRERIMKIAHEKMEGVTSGDLAAKVTQAVEASIVEEFKKGIEKKLRSIMDKSANIPRSAQIILTVINKMSKPAQTDTPTQSSSTEVIKQPRLGLQDQIQHAITLATQLHQAASKEHLDSKEWAANQAAANELLRTFESMQEKANNAAESIESLVATQIKLEVRLKMSALSSKANSSYILGDEIQHYLAPERPSSRERIVKIALEKLEGVASTDLAVKVTEAVEEAILDEFHKCVDQKLRSYMQ